MSQQVLLSQCEVGADVCIERIATPKHQALQMMECGLRPRAIFYIISKRSDGTIIVGGKVRLVIDGSITNQIIVNKF
jgi:hypothetical protein